MANLKFSKIRDGPWFLLFGGGLVLGGRDYKVYNQHILMGFTI